MTIQVEEMLRACEVIATQDNLDVCVTESFKGASIAGLCAFVMGVFLGPMGIAVGGAVGGIAGSSMCKSYKPMWQIMAEMNQLDKVKLANHMLKIVQSLEVTDAILLMTVVSDPTSGARQTIAKELCSYFGTALTGK